MREQKIRYQSKLSFKGASNIIFQSGRNSKSIRIRRRLLVRKTLKYLSEVSETLQDECEAFLPTGLRCVFVRNPKFKNR